MWVQEKAKKGLQRFFKKINHFLEDYLSTGISEDYEEIAKNGRGFYNGWVVILVKS